MFEKLARFIGDSAKVLLLRKDEEYVFRVIGSRVFYLPLRIEKLAQAIGQAQLLHAGVFVGKLTHGGNFHLCLPALPLLEQFAPFRVYLSKTAEAAFVYGNDVMRAQIAKITDGVPENAGVLVCDMDGNGLGFGTTTKSSVDALRSGLGAKIVIRQADIGEFLRNQDSMF